MQKPDQFILENLDSSEDEDVDVISSEAEITKDRPQESFNNFSEIRIRYSQKKIKDQNEPQPSGEFNPSINAGGEDDSLEMIKLVTELGDVSIDHNQIRLQGSEEEIKEP